MSRASHLKRTYGITEDDYEALLQKQGTACGCCRRPAAVFKQRLAVDHDHKTSEVRGLLCLFCNRFIIGRHRRPDGVALLQKAAAYLEGPYTGWLVPEKIKRRRKKRARSKKEVVSKRLVKKKP